MENFTSGHLENRKVRIFDELGNTPSNIIYKRSTRTYYFVVAKSTKNILKNDEEKIPLVTRIDFQNAPKLELLGFICCSIPLLRGQGWIPGQRSRFILMKKSNPDSGLYKKTALSRKKGDYHYVEFDEANNRVRLIGPRAGPTGESEWQPV